VKKLAQTSTGSNYVLAPATNSTLGGVIVGAGLNIIDTGILSILYIKNSHFVVASTTAAQ
jgi:hypothetical protein